MHDPSCVAHEIRYPWRAFRRPTNDFEKRYREPFITIWHNDPERDGTDDSCGWFIRARHADQAVLTKIESAFRFEWSHGCPFGWFDEDGRPNFSVQAIVLDMFRRAAFVIGAERRDGDPDAGRRFAERYMARSLHRILHFAENPVDSLWSSIAGYYREKYPEEKKQPDERISDIAACVYTYILRDIRPWWRHPRWHVHHWSIQIHPLQAAWHRLTRKSDSIYNCAGQPLPPPESAEEPR